MQLEIKNDLQDSKEFADALLDVLGSVVVVLDHNGRIIRFNQAAQELTGYSFSELAGEPIWDWLIPLEMQEAVMNVFKNLLLDKIIGQFQNEWLTKDRGRRMFSWRNTVLRSADGKVSHIVATGEDITERLKLERECLENKERLELALSSSDLGTWDSDLRTATSIFDKQYCAMLGYEVGELVPPSQATWFNLVHPDDRAVVTAAINENMSGNIPTFEFEHRLRHKEGHWVWVLSRGKLYRDTEGKPIRAAGTHLDISLRKRLDEEGADLLNRIEKLMRDVASGSNIRKKKDIDSLESLTKRQRQILEMIATGMTSGEIGKRLKLTTNTIISHRHNLMTKLNLHSTAELTRFAIDQGLMR